MRLLEDPPTAPCQAMRMVDNPVDNSMRLWITRGNVGRRLSMRGRPGARAPGRVDDPVDDAVDGLGMLVERLEAIHRHSGWAWGCAVDAVDRGWKLSAAIHNWAADIPALPGAYPRRTPRWMEWGQSCAPRHSQRCAMHGEGAQSGYPHYPPALILRTTISLFIHMHEEKEERADTHSDLSTTAQLSPDVCGLWRTLRRRQLPTRSDASSACRITASGASWPIHRVNDSAP